MLTREEIFEQIKYLLVEGGFPEEKITMEASFEGDLDADSLDGVELMMELEDQFEIKIPDQDARKLTTVGRVVDYVFGRQPQAA